MQVMCLNGWGGKEHAALVAFLADAQPDVLCLQEVVHTPTAPKDWLEYRDGDHILPQRARFFDDVRQAMPHHTATFCPAAQGVLWDGDVSVPSQWGLATFVRRDLTMVGQIQGFVHKGFGPNGYGDHPRSRNAHGVRLWDFERDCGVSILHTHGLRDLRGKHDTPERLKQARRFAAMMDVMADPKDIKVACGDLNVLPDSYTFQVLREAGLTDLVTGRGFTSTRTDLYPKPQKFADYMLVNTAARDADFDVLQTPVVSDHCPLVLTL